MTRVVRNISIQTIWQLVAKAASSLSTLLVLGLVTRHYGPSLTGVFTLALTYLGFFNLLTDFGFNAHLLPQLVNDNNGKNWQKLLGLRLIWSTILVVISILLIPFLPSNSPLLVLSVILGSISIFGYGLFVTSLAFFQSRIRYDFSTYSSVVGSLGIAGASILIVANLFGLPILLLATSFGWLLAGIVGLFFVSRLKQSLQPLWSSSFFKGTFLAAWPISLTLIFNLLYFRLDSFILASLKSFAEVGLYNVAYSIFQSALVLPTFIMNSFYPLILRQVESKGGQWFRMQFKTMMMAMLGLSVLVAGVTYFFSPFFISLVSGNAGFAGAARSLQILSLGFPAFFLSSVGMWWLIYKKRYKSLVVIYLIGLILNVVLNLIYIPAFSYIASSWITVVSEYLILILQAIILTARKYESNN